MNGHYTDWLGVVGISITADVTNVFVGSVDGFKLLQSNVFTVQSLDQVLLTVNDLQLTSGGPLTNITGLEPAFFVKGSLGFSVVLEVFRCDWGTLYQDFTLVVLSIVTSVCNIDQLNIGDEDLSVLRERRTTVQDISQIPTSGSLDLLENDVLDNIAGAWELPRLLVIVEGSPEELLCECWLFGNLSHDTLFDSFPNSGNTNHDSWLEGLHITNTVSGGGVRQGLDVGVTQDTTPVENDQFEHQFENVSQWQEGNDTVSLVDEGAVGDEGDTSDTSNNVFSLPKARTSLMEISWMSGLIAKMASLAFWALAYSSPPCLLSLASMSSEWMMNLTLVAFFSGLIKLANKALSVKIALDSVWTKEWVIPASPKVS
ncbi:hypothetical protein WICPIJ_004811 [Wickerhamomyces pijperi]|uniref:Uncharacterized protein n=1 Tax=Wickerhamomyces pijperi TaxID=599730 RepID=A0A9P8TMX9_WICPI|nr:hypothetical protein WICPIJ_004811 [Wickerhamomyces pijperi]